MRTIVPALAAVMALAAVPAGAQDGAFARVLQCKNQDARVELYLPAAVAHAGNDWQALETPTTAYYALDFRAPARASRWNRCVSP